MGIIRKILFLIVFVSLSFSGAANAAVDCCVKDGNPEHVPMMMEEPCHDMEEDVKNNDNSCENCGCQHCIGSLFTLVQLKNAIQKISISNSYFDDNFISISINKILQPPKHIS
ncbi:MAG: hypothetical protein PQ612_07080 [Rickettsiales bacterium]|nr:hypothetical protein [Pseudomonadota bacterium]MDA0965771.1 hypothetical protein [Pseudomonadota bacterium]MDG4543767.1 hypothetical protein [Rickettsiales bacterium]MDG4545914.1 hypothetical protein [Rickettsiales bacterium]MDG4548160.1 hypothetical protein [Rickettsiales bacterium]